MNKKFLVLIIILFVFVCLSAVNASEIGNESVSTSDISISDGGGDVRSNDIDVGGINIDLDDSNNSQLVGVCENDEVDYVGGINMDLDDSNNSQLVGVCENDDLIQDEEKYDVEFRGISKKVFFVVGSSETWDKIFQVYYYDGFTDIYLMNSSAFNFYDNGTQFDPVSFDYIPPIVPFLDEPDFKIKLDVPMGVHNITIEYLGNEKLNPANFTFTLIGHPQMTSNVFVDYAAGKINVNFSPKSVKDMTGQFDVMLDDKTLATGTFDNSVGTATFDILDPGYYTFKFAYKGDGKYPAFDAYTYDLRIYGNSQWGLPGYDNKNSANPDYIRQEGVSILWTGSVNNPVSSPIIDYEGNIYVVNFNNIAVFSNNGRIIHTVDDSYDGNGALSLYKNYYLMYVRSVHTIVGYDITKDYATNDQTDYYVLRNTYSKYAPIFDNNGKIYLSIVKEPLDDYYIICLSVGDNGIYKYEGREVNSLPLDSPVMDSKGILWVNTVGGIYAVNSTSFEILLNNSDIGVVGRPIIDDNDIVYAFGKNNRIYALNSTDILWNVTVNKGIGSVMAIDNANDLLYSVNNKCILCRYDSSNNGSELEIYNIGANVTSIIVDAKGTVYVADVKGRVWAFDSEGNLLWNIDFKESINTQMAMDKEGILYVLTSNHIYALGFSYEFTIEAKNTTVFVNESVTVKISNNISGNVTVTFNGEDHEVKIDEGIATLDLGKLPAGNYMVSASYPSSGKYDHAYAETVFEISKINPEITWEVNASVKNTTIDFTLPENATGRVFVKIDGKDLFAEVEDGKASVSNIVLESGNYTADVTYSGDENYNNDSLKFVVNVPQLLDSGIKADIQNTTVIVDINKNATGDVIITVGKISFIQDAKNLFPVDVSEYLTSGVYNVTVEYGGDDKFLGKVLYDNLKVNKIAVDVYVAVNSTTVKVGETATVIIKMNPGINASVKLNVGGKIYTVAIVGGVGFYEVFGLNSGVYDINVTYVGDDKYIESKNATKLIVNSTTLSGEVVALNVTVEQNTSFIINAADDFKGNVSISVDGKVFYDGEVKSLINSVKLLAGNKTAVAVFYGDDNYDELTVTAEFTVFGVTPDIDVKIADVTYPANAVAWIIIGNNANGTVNIVVDDKIFNGTVVEGKDSVNLTGLSEGAKVAIVEFFSTDKYNNNVAVSVNFNVNNNTSDISNVTIIVAKKSVKFKRNKNKKFTVRLKTKEGEYLAGQKVFFKLDKKILKKIKAKNKKAKKLLKKLKKGTYALTTKSTGKATLTLKKSMFKCKKGKGKVTTSFKGTDNYKKSSITAKITMK